jgi:hypothetical protein
MSETPDPVEPGSSASPIGFFDFDGVQLPVFDLAAFESADIHRVSSFSTNFGHWELPAEVGGLLGVPAGAAATLEWIHDTGELVLLGGVPTVSNVAIEETGFSTLAGGVPAFLGGSIAGGYRDSSGMIRDYVRSEVLAAGTRLAVLAHIAHGPQAHELLWGWHREHGKPEGWNWLVERLARLEGSESADHLG